MAASGLRSLRYAREVEGIGKIVALDIDKGTIVAISVSSMVMCTEFFFVFYVVFAASTASIEACKKNIQFNGSLTTSKVEAHHADARVYMLTHPKEYDVVTIIFFTFSI